MIGRRRLFAALAPALLARRAAADGTPPVDVELVLAVDSSSSVTMAEYYLQLEGYAGAFRHPDLARAVASGPGRAIGVCMFEFAGPRWQRVNFEWRRLASEGDLEQFSDELALAPRLVIGGDTAIGQALVFALALHEASPFPRARRVIDVSGDGPSNSGVAVGAVRDEALARGVTVNGVAILNEEPGLADYYRRAVVGGPGAFVIPARDYEDFAEAILKKLLREVQTIV